MWWSRIGSQFGLLKYNNFDILVINKFCEFSKLVLNSIAVPLENFDIIVLFIVGRDKLILRLGWGWVLRGMSIMVGKSSCRGRIWSRIMFAGSTDKVRRIIFVGFYDTIIILLS
jgi:hypothetical protein